MPVKKHMMANLKAQYGDKKGEDVYYAMENKAKHGGKSKATKKKKK